MGQITLYIPTLTETETCKLARAAMNLAEERLREFQLEEDFPRRPGDVVHGLKLLVY